MNDLSTAAGSAAPRAEPNAAPIIIGHRGASGYVPEHTLASYFIAIEQGADYIEPDLVSTRDGALIARHENEIGATTDVGRRPEFASRKTRKTIDGQTIEGWFCEDFTLEEIKTLKARERIADIRPGNARLDGAFAIPTLEEILSLLAAVRKARQAAALARGVEARAPIGVYPETKHPTYFARCGLALEAPLLAALERHGYASEDAPVFIQSFETENLKALRKVTRLPLVQLIEAAGAPYDLAARGETGTYRDLTTQRGLAEIAGYADAVGVAKQLVIPRTAEGTLGPVTALVRDAHAEGLKVHAWTFRAENHFLPAALRAGSDPTALGNVVAEVEAYLRAGVDGVFTDQPALGVEARARVLRRG
ncbi:MAG: glycerophosphodiester phosphodiesterase [Steroidobacteraceae bacterium]